MKQFQSHIRGSCLSSFKRPTVPTVPNVQITPNSLAQSFAQRSRHNGSTARGFATQQRLCLVGAAQRQQQYSPTGHHSAQTFYLQSGQRFYSHNVASGTDVSSSKKSPRAWNRVAVIAGVASTGLLVCLYLAKDRSVTPAQTLSPLDRSILHILSWNDSFLSKTLTRTVGLFTDLPIPRPLRQAIFGAFAKRYNCNLDEADRPVTEYTTWNDFFARALAPGSRVISAAPLVSPADGQVLHYGTINVTPNQFDNLETAPFPEQVKGSPYSLTDLLGTQGFALFNKTFAKTALYSSKKKNDNTRLYYCTIYLSPANYHRFHSPTDWKVNYSCPIPGRLLSVAPAVMAAKPGLVSHNKRHSIVGEWAYGSLAMVPVGAQIVGQIHVALPSSNAVDADGKHHGADTRASNAGGSAAPLADLQKGQPVGHFCLGSTVVLIFQAPSTFEWSEKVKLSASQNAPIMLGDPLGRIASP